MCGLGSRDIVGFRAFGGGTSNSPARHCIKPIAKRPREKVIDNSDNADQGAVDMAFNLFAIRIDVTNYAIMRDSEKERAVPEGLAYKV